MAFSVIDLKKLLIERGLLDEKKIQSAEERAKKEDKTLETVLFEMDVVSDSDL